MARTRAGSSHIGAERGCSPEPCACRQVEGRQHRRNTKVEHLASEMADVLGHPLPSVAAPTSEHYTTGSCTPRAAQETSRKRWARRDRNQRGLVHSPTWGSGGMMRRLSRAAPVCEDHARILAMVHLLPSGPTCPLLLAPSLASVSVSSHPGASLARRWHELGSSLAHSESATVSHRSSHPSRDGCRRSWRRLLAYTPSLVS